MPNEPVYINEIEIADYKCFKGKHKFSFTDEKGDWCQWTVFLGNNNTGKTNLLKEIFEHCRHNPEFMSYEEDSIITPLKVGYGVVRNIETTGISNSKLIDIGNLLDNSNLINFEEWLFQLDYAVNNPTADENNRKRTAVKKDLLINVLKSEIFPEINNIRFTSSEKAENYIEYQTKDGWYRLYELGYGYQAMLAWLMDFANKMFDRYPDSKNPLKEPAVLLVDEIDLHLHPYWQRTIIQYLSNLLPQTQFIVTTHSPFILQSMESVNLYTLRREDDYTITKHLGNRSFVGWGIEEILSEIMELDNDIKTNRYQELSQKFDEALADENYEKAKQTYDELVKILNPANSKIKIMEIQLSQIAHD